MMAYFFFKEQIGINEAEFLTTTTTTTTTNTKKVT